MKIVLVAPGHKEITESVHGGGQQSCKDICQGLVELGHEVFIVGHPMTDLECISKLYPYLDDEKNAVQILQFVCKEVLPDVILDSSAFHMAANVDLGVARVNRLPQPRQPGIKYPNTVVNSQWMAERNPAKVIMTAMKDEGYEELLQEDWSDYVVYSGRDYSFKGIQHVQRLKKAGAPIISIENVDKDIYFEVLAKAKYLLHPSVEDAAPRAPIEAAMMGVPTLCLNMSGAVDQVLQGRTGYICNSLHEVFDRIKKPRELSSSDIRDAMLSDRSYDQMIKQYESILQSAVNGETW